MIILPHRLLFLLLIASMLLLLSCAPAKTPSAEVPIMSATTLSAQIQVPLVTAASIVTPTILPGFVVADGSRPLTFPADFGAHPDFRTEWWYYTGNLQTTERRHFGFELTIFRVGLLPPTAELPNDSDWSSRDVYFAHFAVSDIRNDHFYAFQRYSRPGPGLAGAEADPYHVWSGWRIGISPNMHRVSISCWLSKRVLPST